MALVVRKHKESQQAQSALLHTKSSMPSAVQNPSVQWWDIDVPEDTSLALHLQHAVDYVPWQQCVQHTELIWHWTEKALLPYTCHGFC